VLIDKFDGKPLNSPNDVVVKSDDSIWFTDPPFGILGNYEGHVATPELPTNVYRLDPKSGRATVVAGDINRPNGLCFSPDESKMYIVEAGLNPRVIRVYDVSGDKLANSRTFITAEPAAPPTASAATSMAICGADGEWATRSRTASRFSIRAASRSVSSHYRSVAPICASGESSATACSWRRAIRSIRFM
jgi:hypothetical protein